MAQVEAACLRPDASLFSIPLPLRSLVVKGTSSLAECGERLAQQLSFGHFGVPAGVVPPDVRLSDVAGVSVMVLQLRNLEKGYVLAVKPSKGLPPFPGNPVADKMLQNQQLHVFGSALVVRHTYVAQTGTNSYVPLSVTELGALIRALPGSGKLVAEAQRLAAIRQADRELLQDFSAEPLAQSVAVAAAAGPSFSVRSFGQAAGASSAVPKATIPLAKAAAKATQAGKAKAPAGKAGGAGYQAGFYY